MSNWFLGLIISLLAATTMHAQNYPSGYIAAAKTPHWHERVRQFAAESVQPGCYLFLGNFTCF